VGDLVGDLVWDLVGDLVWDLVGDLVGDLVRVLVGFLVGVSVRLVTGILVAEVIGLRVGVAEAFALLLLPLPFEVQEGSAVFADKEQSTVWSTRPITPLAKSVEKRPLILLASIRCTTAKATNSFMLETDTSDFVIYHNCRGPN
jgi:hypothetical protein